MSTLTIIKGARGSGKTTAIYDLLKMYSSFSVVLCANEALANVTRRNFTNANIVDYPQISGLSSGTVTRVQVGTPQIAVFTSVHSAKRAIEFISNQVGFNKVIYMDNVDMMHMSDVIHVAQVAKKSGIPIAATFTPTCVTPYKAKNIAWLNLPQWYSQEDITYIELNIRHNEKDLKCYRDTFSPSAFRTQILGEYTIED